MTVRQVGVRLKVDGKAEVKRELQEFGQAGREAGQDVVGGVAAAGKAIDGLGDKTDRQMARWRAMAKAAKEAATEQERAAAAQARYNSLLGVGGGAGLKESDLLSSAELGGARALTRNERASRLNLLRQAADVAVTAPTMNPAMIALQQGPQILDALATSGLKASAAGIAVGGAFVAAAAAVVGAGIAQAKYEKSVKDVEVATRGLGAAAGITADGVLRQADAAAQAGEISASSARQFATEYVSTGRIGQGVLQDLVALTKDYAVTTRQDAAGATKELAAAFSDPAKGAKDLNDKLNFLSTAELEHIENLARAGREAEAQALIVEQLKGALVDASDATTGWGHALEGLKRTALDGFDAVGRFVDRLVTGGNSEMRVAAARQTIADADRELANTPKWMRDIPGSSATEWARKRREAQQVIDQEYAKYVQDMDRQREAAQNRQDSDRRGLVDRYNPDAGRLRNARADREKLIGLGVKDEAGKEALKDLNADIAAMEKGYRSAADMATQLGRVNRSNAKDAREAGAEARKREREREEAAREELSRQDHVRDNALKLAQIRGDQSVIEQLQAEAREQQEVNRWVREGLSLDQARVNARATIAAEAKAEAMARREGLQPGDDFVSAEASMAKALAAMGPDFKVFSARTALFEDLRVNTRQAFGDGLMEAAEGGSFFSVFASRLKSAAASALVGIATDGLFGNRDGSKTGLISSAMTFFLPKNKYAHGTPSSAAGLALVGEKGPELVNLPGGSRVHTADDTMRKLTSMASAAMAPAAPMVSITYAPVLNAQGAGPREVDELKAMMARQQAEFEGRVINTVQEAVGRRTLKVS